VKAGVVGEDYDDSEGYYKATIGEVIYFNSSSPRDGNHPHHERSTSSAFKVLGIIGKGVFSTVLKCTSLSSLPDEEKISHTPTQPAAADSATVAIKLIRNNETMSKAAQKERHILQLLSKSSSSQDRHPTNHNIVRLLSQYDNDTHNLEYRHHTCLLFEHLSSNLRQTLVKFGHKIGINLTAVKSYARQLFGALHHLSKHQIVHADIKPDNILVSGDYATVKLCDFGSAFFETDVDNDPTPYLVSRFYRPPEVILGLEYDRQVDLWSLAVTVAELFVGQVLFAGKSNNDMIKLFMDAVGPFSKKMLKRHFLSYQKLQLQPHFQRDTLQFRRQDVDKVTGQSIIRMEIITKPVFDKQIGHVLIKARTATEERGQVLKLADLLQRCLALDPARRIKVEEVLKHDLFVIRRVTHNNNGKMLKRTNNAVATGDANSNADSEGHGKVNLNEPEEMTGSKDMNHS